MKIVNILKVTIEVKYLSISKKKSRFKKGKREKNITDT